MKKKYEHLMRYNAYAILKGVTQQSVRNWAESGKIKTTKIEGRSLVVLTPEEIKERREKGI